jgi:DNA helicase-2/ATP-dependent DNA helicase PcrA
MVEEELEPEVQEILSHVSNGDNFLLSGGAGSGKTYSLVSLIKNLIKNNPTSKVACMTYTNAAVKEIEERVNHDNLSVTTIHDFLWDNIKFFQKDLKKSLVELVNAVEPKIIHPDAPVTPTCFDGLIDGIQYKEFTRIKDGIISHDELLILANHMFEKYLVLNDILKDKFKYIFIDEYQDTNELVIQIFLEHLKRSEKKNIIGFFGDSMQSIYEEGIGDLQKYIDDGSVKEVIKAQNRRNPKSVIDLANQLRTDSVVQVPSSDLYAPNMLGGLIKPGSITFLYSSSNDLEAIKTNEIFADWDFNNSKETKELNLTHNLIAPKAGFPELMAIYDKDPVFKFKGEVTKKIKEDNLSVDENLTFDQVADIVAPGSTRNGLKKTALLSDADNAELYNQVKDIPFAEIRRIYLTKEALIDDKKQDETDENKKGSKRDNLIKHLFKIQNMVHLYNVKRYNEFIRKTELQITKVQHKTELKEVISTIEGMSELPIEDVIEFVHNKGICIKGDHFVHFVTKYSYLYNRVKKVKFKEFQNLYKYLEGYTPFSTQHKIKGAEFENVLVILDNGKWNDYNFKNLFLLEGSTSVLENTQKIFYVCCTRAKERLVVFYHNPSPAVIAKAKVWFGETNVKEVHV